MTDDLIGMQLYLRSMFRLATEVPDTVAAALELTHSACVSLKDFGDVDVALGRESRTTSEDLEFLKEHLRIALREIHASRRIADTAVDDIKRVADELTHDAGRQA